MISLIIICYYYLLFRCLVLLKPSLIGGNKNLQKQESYIHLRKVFSDSAIFNLYIYLANNRQLTFRFWKLPGIRRSLTPPAIMDSDPFSVTTVLCEVEPSAGHIYCCLRVHVLITCHGHSAPGKRICSLEAQYSAFIEKCAGKRFTSHLTLNPRDPKALSLFVHREIPNKVCHGVNETRRALSWEFWQDSVHGFPLGSSAIA